MVIADALHAQCERARPGTYRQAQPARLACPARRPCPGGKSRSLTTPANAATACGTALKVAAAATGWVFPARRPGIQIVHRRRLTGKNDKKMVIETLYAITLLTIIQTRPAAGTPLRSYAATKRSKTGCTWSATLFATTALRSAPALKPCHRPAYATLVMPSWGLTGYAGIIPAQRYHAHRLARPLETIMQC